MGQRSPWVEIGAPPDRLWVHSYIVQPENQVKGKPVQDESEAVAIARRFIERHWGVTELEVMDLQRSLGELDYPGVKGVPFVQVWFWSEPRPRAPNHFYAAVKMSSGQVVTVSARQRQQR
jgi:hypothetical protein